MELLAAGAQVSTSGFPSDFQEGRVQGKHCLKQESNGHLIVLLAKR